MLEPYLSFLHVSGGDILSKRKSTIGAENKVKLHRLDYSVQLKQYTKLPVITCGNYDCKNDVNEALEKGVDGVVIGRCLIANASFVMTNLLQVDHIDDKYHWNNNPWYKHSDFIK
ncbi:hypothetical protein [Spiroplasma endosymbiont of Diplazon laetatorius]|uniref:hypothetical protein n=1 Tax=Spiroplasma endosymbiont of Diplazon laetatorius TaxID=3066322 RepID=UPI0030D18C7D